MQEPVEHLLVSDLEGGERLLWSGRARQGVRLGATDALLIPMSLLWGGFAFFWEYMVITGNAPWFFALWGIPFVLVGLYMIAGRFFWDAKRRATTYYGVTNRRLIIRSGVWRSKTRSVNLRNLSDVSMTERADGSGDIVLGTMLPMMSWFVGSGWPGMGAQMPPVLEGVPRVREIYALIRQGQTSAT